MKAKFVYENIEFERGRDPRKSMDIGVAVENRDPYKMKENFERDFPMFRGHTGELHGAAGDWTTYTAEARNPKDGKKIMDRKGEILDWFKTHTDYDVVKLESAFDRRFHPWGDPKQPLEWNQQFTVHLGYKNNIKESVNFERGEDPKETMKIGKASKPNYFRDHLEGIPYKEWMLDNTDWPWGEGKDILKNAADMFGVSENEVLIAVEYDNDPLTTSRIEQVMDDHEWEYGDSEGHTDSFDLVSSSTGEIYVVDMEERTPYMILGTAF